MDYVRRRLWRQTPAPSSAATDSHSDQQEQKEDTGFDVIQDFVPLRFLENRIRTLSRTSVPHNLRCLDQHKDNMQRMLTEQDWERLSAEQLNASRTVQQLKGHLQTLDELRSQVEPSELSSFDHFTETLRNNILTAVHDYQDMTVAMETARGGGGEGVAEDDMTHEEQEDEGQMLLLAQRSASHYQSLESLRTDLIELNDLVKQLNATANDHSSRVAVLNSRTEQAAASVHVGVADLRGGQRLKAYVLPIGGAIVGGVLGGAVGGPIGVVAGLKIGALAAATAGTAGVLGGALLGYKVRKATAESAEQGGNSSSSHQRKND